MIQGGIYFFKLSDKLSASWIAVFSPTLAILVLLGCYFCILWLKIIHSVFFHFCTTTFCSLNCKQFNTSQPGLARQRAPRSPCHASAPAHIRAPAVALLNAFASLCAWLPAHHSRAFNLCRTAIHSPSLRAHINAERGAVCT